MAKNKISVFEVGPRGGLQNEKRSVSLQHRFSWIADLASAGLKDIEVGAFVRPDRVPQMKDSEELLSKLPERSGVTYWSLVPNEKGLQRAIAVRARAIGLFTAATDEFCQRNMGMSQKETLNLFPKLIRQARKHRMKIRGYVSTALGCPFSGKVVPKQVLPVVEALLEAGCDEVSVGDTIGVGDGRSVQKLVSQLIKNFSKNEIAMHFHDTRGNGLANAWISYSEGIQRFDSSAGGLGGCPFAPGATGNLATEDLVYFFNQSGIETGVNFEALCAANLKFQTKVGGPPLPSRALQAFASQSRGT